MSVQLPIDTDISQCAICLEFSILIALEECHECRLCANCLTLWVEQNTQMTLIEDVTKIKCPIDLCPNFHSIAAIQQIFRKSNSDESTLNEILLKNYLRHTFDVVPCPNSICKSYGTLPNDWCLRGYQCNDCGNVWKAPSLITQVKDSRNQLLTLLFSCLFLKHCPNPTCGISIEKTGGCSHMLCKKCNYYFCWYCQQGLNKGHSTLKCAINIFFYKTMLLYMLVSMMEVLGLLKLIINPTRYLLNGFFIFVSANFILIFPLFGGVCAIVASFELAQYCYKKYLPNWCVKKNGLNHLYKIHRHKTHIQLASLGLFLCTLATGVSWLVLFWVNDYSWQGVVTIIVLQFAVPIICSLLCLLISWNSRWILKKLKF